MTAEQAFAAIKAGVERSVATASDDWIGPALAAGLAPGPNTSVMGFDQTHSATFADGEVRLHHRWYDTSGPFSPGPDRTKLTLTLLRDEEVVDRWFGTFDN